MVGCIWALFKYCAISYEGLAIPWLTVSKVSPGLYTKLEVGKVMLNEASHVDFYYLVSYSLSGLFRRIMPTPTM